MKVLLDSCLSGKTAEMLRTAGHDVVWVGNWPADPGDAAILARARAERRILVKLDKDFGELAIVRGEPHCGIVRLVNCSVTRQADTWAACWISSVLYAVAVDSGTACYV